MSSVIQNVKLEQIDFDLSMQSRAKMDESAIAEYAEAITEGAKFPPITVFRDSATYWLADGFHRYFAHKKIGALDIEAEVIVGTKRDATLHSVGANAKHGLRRTDADKRRAVLRLLEDQEWGKWSNREIARRCGVHPTTVARVKDDVDAFYRGEGRDEGGHYRPGREVVFNSSAVMKIPTVHVDSEERTYTTKHGTEAVMDIGNIGKKKERPAPSAPKKEVRNLESDPLPEERKDESDDLAQAYDTIAELAAENDRLMDHIAVGQMEGSDIAKADAMETMAELREQVKSLEIENDALKASRDTYMHKVGEMQRQINYWRRQAEKVVA